MKKENHLSIIFLGEGATEEGVFPECMNFAALKKLPVLFVCENNYYSVYSPLDVRQPKERDRVGIARAHGLKASAGYGNDVEEVYRISRDAVSFIREGGGPVFLEFETYRYREHCGPHFDNDIGYRTPEEASFWEKKCPVLLQQARLPCSQTELSSFRVLIQQEIEEAFDFADKSPFPSYDPVAETPYA
jgi:pyruvate dehydrogenase E1 component alpha subunit